MGLGAKFGRKPAKNQINIIICITYSKQGLNMSRCLGDLMGHQDCGISSEPEVKDGHAAKALYTYGKGADTETPWAGGRVPELLSVFSFFGRFLLVFGRVS